MNYCICMARQYVRQHRWMWPTTRCKHTIHKHPVNHTCLHKACLWAYVFLLKHRLSLSSKCHLKHIILQIFIFHSSNESLSLINQFTPCFLVSNVSLIKSILLAECFSEQLGRRLVPMMVFSQQPLEEAGDEHMTCRRSWFQSDVSSE